MSIGSNNLEEGWTESIDGRTKLRPLEPGDIQAMVSNGAYIVGLRDPAWFGRGYIEGSILIPLGQVEKRRSDVPWEKEVAVICEHGVRSSTTASLLKRHGFDRCLNVIGGINGWRKTRYPRAKYRE